MGFGRLKELVENAYDGGQHQITSFRKVPAIASTAGSVIDVSMAPGNPRANYYTGDEKTATRFIADRGFYHGGNVSPQTKHLRKITVLANNAGWVPAALTICDYLLFYPLIDMDSTDEQALTNTLTLPRYTTGLGVRAFLVATNPYIGGMTFFIEYTNSDGVTGRISRIMTSNTNTYIGTVVHSGVATGMHGTFINLAPGDQGIRSVEKVTFLNPNGGLATLVLCAPLANVYMREITQFNEWDFLTMKTGMPRIYDGAYLGMLAAVNGSVSGQILTGFFETVWN